MIRTQDLEHYIDSLTGNCVQVVPIIDTELGVILQTTEVYQFEHELELNTKVGALKDHPGFLSCSKKFVPAKEKKGEIVEDEYWKLTVKIKHFEE